MNGDNVTYFDSFRVKYIAKQIKKFIGNKNITNICRIQSTGSIMCGYFCIGCIDFLLSLLDYTNTFYCNKYKKNYEIILKHFQ